MEFKIPVAEMQSIIQKMANVAKVNEDDLTSMVLVDVVDNVRFYCTNPSITIVVVSNECEVIDKGRVLIKFKDIKEYLLKFTPLADNYGTECFHFISNESQNLIKTKTQFPSGKSSYRRLKFRSYNNIYNIKNHKIPNPFDLDETQLIINSDILKKGISRVLYCVNPGEIREALTGLNVTAVDDHVIFTGSDGVKLTEFITNIDAKMEQFGNIFTFGFSSVLYNLLDGDSQVFIKFKNNKVYIIFNDIYVEGTLIVGEEYPNYKSMLQLDEFLTIPRVDFVDSIYSSMAVLDEEDNNRLTINMHDKQLMLKNDRLEATHDFDNSFEFDLDVDVNGAYLASLLRDFGGENLEIYYKEGNNYIVFKSDDDTYHTALLTVVQRR